MSVAPPRSLEQRRSALEKANGIRIARANLKRDFKARRTEPLHILFSPPDYVLTMKVYELLLATPKYGRTKAMKTLNAAKVSPAKTIGGLTKRQREEIVRFMRR